MPICSAKDLYANINLLDTNIMGWVKRIHDDCAVLGSFSDEKIILNLAEIDIFSIHVTHFKGLLAQVLTDTPSPGGYAIAAHGEREITVRFIELDDGQKNQMRMMANDRSSGS